MFQSIGTTEWIIVAIVVILLFGGRKIPELFKGVKDAIKEFKKSSSDSSDEESEEN